MKKLLIFLTTVAAMAQQVTLSDTLTGAVGGSAYTGRIAVTLSAPGSAQPLYYSTTSLGGWQYVLCVGVTGADCSATTAAGVVSIPLYANSTITPAGTSYAVRFSPSRGSAWTETWTVEAADTKLYQVRATTVPSPTTTFQPSQLALAAGSMVYGSSAGVGTALAAGTNGHVLTLSGGYPSWAAASGGGGGVSSLTGTANQITASASTGAVTLSIPINPTLPGTTTGVFSGNAIIPIDSDIGVLRTNANTSGAYVLDRSQTNESGIPDYSTTLTMAAGDNGATVRNHVYSTGYNRGVSGKQVSGKHAFYTNIESDYTTAGGTRQLEYYIGFESADDAYLIRPFSITPRLATNYVDIALRADATVFGATNYSNDWLTLYSSPSSGSMVLHGNSTLSYDGSNRYFFNNSGVNLIGYESSVGYLMEALKTANFFDQVDIADHTLSLRVGRAEGTGTRALRWNHTDMKWQFQTGASTYSYMVPGTVDNRAVLDTTTPANSSAACVAGSVWADASYIYACTATNTIKRAALSTF